MNRKLDIHDRDLMLFVDGELDAARRTDVQSRIETDPTARRKVAALRLTGELVRERPIDLGIADGIADAVMAKIAAEPTSDPKPVVPLEPSRAAKPPANDNARRIYYLAAVAVAAAAALMIWSKSDTRPIAGLPVVPETARMPEAPLMPAPETTAQRGDEPSPDGELDMGVEVAAVDFGARQGTIFYVPNGAAEAHTTTVVWLADDSAGDE